jgi:type VI secretion system protein ImpD
MSESADKLRVPSLVSDQDELDVTLVFREWTDFTPCGVAVQVPEIARLVTVREGLSRIALILSNQQGEQQERFHSAVLSAVRQSARDAGNPDAARSLVEDIASAVPAIDRDKIASALYFLKADEAQGRLCDIYGNDSFSLVVSCAEKVDLLISQQLHPILASDPYRQLAAVWAGVKSLCDELDGCENCELHLLNCSRDGLRAAIDSGRLREILTAPQGGLSPASASLLVTDFEFDGASVDLLSQLAGVCRTVFTPVIANAAPTLAGRSSWAASGTEYGVIQPSESLIGPAWNAFRGSEDAQFVCLCCPSVYLSPLDLAPNDNARFRFIGQRSTKSLLSVGASWFVAARLARSFAQRGLPTHVEGPQDGVLSGLRSTAIRSLTGDEVGVGPLAATFSLSELISLIEIGITPLTQFHEPSGYGVFFCTSVYCSTGPIPRRQRFNEIVCAARIIHHVLAGLAQSPLLPTSQGHSSRISRADAREWITHYLANYVLDDPAASPEMIAKYPLCESAVKYVPELKDRATRIAITLRLSAFQKSDNPPATLHRWEPGVFRHHALKFYIDEFRREEQWYAFGIDESADDDTDEDSDEY